MKQLWAPWRMTYVTGETERSGECIFCAMWAAPDADVANGVVARGERSITVVNRFPYSSGHLLVVPSAHCQDPTSLDDPVALDLHRATSRALTALRTVMNPDGFNVGLNLGAAAGGSIDHLHVHLVPRWQGDTNFMPVLGDVKVLPEHLEATAARLREALAAS